MNEVKQAVIAANKDYSKSYEELMDMVYEFVQRSTFNQRKQPVQAVDLVGLKSISNKIDEVIRLGYLAQGIYEAASYHEENKPNSHIQERMKRPVVLVQDPRALFEALRF